MGKSGTYVEFNPAFFDNIMKEGRIGAFTRERAEAVRELAYETAPVDTGDYREGLTVERHQSKYRDSYRVVGHDWKTLLVEAKTGNLARAVKALRRAS